jgi:hypothetical protein
MTRSIILSLIIISVFSNFNCGKEDEVSTPNCIKAKLVSSSCASKVVQILDTAYFPLAQASWTPLNSNVNISNVFTVANHCNFNKANQIAVGDTFYFKIETVPVDSNCVVCMLYDAPPQKSLAIVSMNGPCKIDSK